MAGGNATFRSWTLAVGTITGIVSLQTVVSAQYRQPQFDLASIREIVNGVRVLGEFRSSGPRAEYNGFGIQALIAEAWTVRADQVALAPAVLANTVYPMLEAGRSARIYNIVALTTEGTAPNRDEFRPMLQSLLATRFKLAIHPEKRDKPVYVLAAGGKPELKRNSGDGRCRTTWGRTPEGQKLVATHCPIQTMIDDLFVDRPIYDETGLTDFYDFEITAALPFQTNDPQASTPFSAVKELGLKLEPKQRAVDMLVIDHVESPEPN